MENASKALLIAGAVLIVILIVTVGIKIFTSSSDTQKAATDTGKTISDTTEKAISEISNGNNNKKYEILELSYGKIVSGYTGYEATDITSWKLFYVDKESNEAFIIASNYISLPWELTKYGIPEDNGYTGSNDVRKLEYARKYNGIWLSKCTTDNTHYISQKTAYMCNPNNWKQYKSGKAKYAVGGPTFELLTASFYNKQVKELKNEGWAENVNTMGYPNIFSTELNSNVRDKLYSLGNGSSSDYWLASSPSFSNGSTFYYVRGNKLDSGSGSNYGYVQYRPIVCLPISSIEINGKEDNISLEYK